jgi:hypothetical protein
MAIASTPAPIDLSHISEILEVAHIILQRRRDQDLAQKTFTVQEYLEISKRHAEWDYNELLHKALADLTSTLHLRLNAELQVISSLLARLS